MTDEWHPLQVLADMLTIKEKLGVLKQKKIVFVGDARNNVASSLMVIASKLGMNYFVLSPQQLQPDPVLIEQCQQLTKQTGGSLTVTNDWRLATRQADVIYTDV